MKLSSSKPEPLREKIFPVRRIMKQSDLTFVIDLLSFHSQEQILTYRVSYTFPAFKNIPEKLSLHSTQKY